MPSEFRCAGDVLETCKLDGSGFAFVEQCEAGLCDAAGKQCASCKANESKCLDGTTLEVCDPTGLSKATVSCASPTPLCVGAPGSSKCVACAQAADCPLSSSECALPACSLDGNCGTTPVAAGAPCGAPAAGGTCDGFGVCRFCQAGESRCTGLTPEACDANGQWVAGVACGGAKPLCVAGACVMCATASDCPKASNECVSPSCDAKGVCGFASKVGGTPCSNGLGKCDANGQCNLCTPGTAVCNGNIPLVCGSNGQFVAQSACGGVTPVCDPMSGACVGCAEAKDCAPPSDCLDVSCVAKLCAYTPKQTGTPCAGGKCSPLGTCQACAPGETKCQGNALATCNAGGTGFVVTACSQPDPFCDTGKCTHRGPSMTKVDDGSGNKFFIDSTEVTNEQYLAFLTDPTVQLQSNTLSPPFCAWNKTYTPTPDWPPTPDKLKQPVTRVDWCDASAYCSWAGKRLCGKIGGGSLVTSEVNSKSTDQWYLACGGTGSTAYPYGDAYVPMACNGQDNGKSATVDVGSMPNCVSIIGKIFDLSGNVMEWFDSCVPNNIDPTGASDACRVRGGSFTASPDNLKCTTTNTVLRSVSTTKNIGIRCCAD